MAFVETGAPVAQVVSPASSRTVAPFSRGRDLPEQCFVKDPSLRLNNGCARDDAGRKKSLEPSHYDAEVCFSTSGWTRLSAR